MEIDEPKVERISEEEEEEEDGEEIKPEDRDTIVVHITDSHMGSTKLNTRRAKFILDHICWFYSQETEKNVVVVHTGDLIDKGSEDKLWKQCTVIFENFTNRMKEALGDRFRFYQCVGNHDIGTGFKMDRKHYKSFENAVSGFADNHPSFYVNTPNRGICQSVEDFGGIRFILLNSQEKTCPEEGESGVSWAKGELGEDQRKWLDKVLEDSGDDRRVLIFMHHHPFKTKGGVFILRNIMNSTYLHALKDEEEFKDILRKHKHRLLGVGFGHRHWREFVEIEGINRFEKKQMIEEEEEEEEEKGNNNKNDENPSKPFLYGGGSLTHGPRMICQRKKVFDDFRFRSDTKELYERNKWVFKSLYLKSYTAKFFRTNLSQRKFGEIEGQTKKIYDIKRRYEDYDVNRPLLLSDDDYLIEKEEGSSNSLEEYVKEVESVAKEENEGEGDDEESIIEEFIPAKI